MHSRALNNSVIVCEALAESRMFSQSTSTLTLNAMFIFAVLLVHVTKQVAMRTLHIRAKSFGVPLLVAVGAMVVWTFVIAIRTMAEVPNLFFKFSTILASIVFYDRTVVPWYSPTLSGLSDLMGP